MSKSPPTHKNRKPARPWRRWVHRAFLCWALFSTTYIIQAYITRGVPAETLESTADIIVSETSESLVFRSQNSKAVHLAFLCGSGVAPAAYAPMLRPIAEAGYSVHIIALPFRLAPLNSHRVEAIHRVHQLIRNSNPNDSWIISGHSLGAALACRFALKYPNDSNALCLIGTTHPKRDDLSHLEIPVTKVYATEDHIAPYSKSDNNRHLLPSHTTWVKIDGGNHSQFGHYGHQLLDGTATISRAKQQQRTQQAILSLCNQLGHHSTDERGNAARDE